MPPIAIRTRPSSDSPRRSASSSSQATGKEHRDDAALCMDALERDEPPEDSEKKLTGLPILTGLVRPLATPPSPSRRFRFPFPAILGISHTSGSRISDMDSPRSLEHLPSLEETLHLQASAVVVTQSANAQDARLRWMPFNPKMERSIPRTARPSRRSLVAAASAAGEKLVCH